MAWQRWDESVGHGLGRVGRLGLVAGLLLGLSACEGQRDLFGPSRPLGQGSNTSNSPLVGTWEVTLIVSVDGDLQTWTTNWQFRSDRTCTWRQIIESAVEGLSREEVRDCTWTDANSAVTVVYLDTGASETLPYSFPTFDTSRLILQGVEYLRL